MSRKAPKLTTMSEGFTAQGITITSKSDMITDLAWKFYFHKPYAEDWGSINIEQRHRKESLDESESCV